MYTLLHRRGHRRFGRGGRRPLCGQFAITTSRTHQGVIQRSKLPVEKPLQARLLDKQPPPVEPLPVKLEAHVPVEPLPVKLAVLDRRHPRD